MTFCGVLISIWTAILAGSTAWNIHDERRDTLRMVYTEALSSFNKDLIYRRWVAGHGGVYVPATDKTPPNPYLSHIKERDISTPSGRALTLVNPAYMTRQIYVMAEKQYGVRGHITSLNPIRHENAPDPWEAKALQAFVNGRTEVTETIDMNGEPYFRFMRPMITEEGCLKCHAIQGYKLGDIRGGISVSLPMKKYYIDRNHRIRNVGAGHFLLWMLGLLGLVMSARTIKKSIEASEHAEKELKISQERLVTVFNSFDALVYVADMKTYEIIFVNKHMQNIFGNIEGKVCWQTIQIDQTGPCGFCTNNKIVDSEGVPLDPYTWEFQNTRTGRWFYAVDRAIRWVDGRTVRLEVATDITERKKAGEALRKSEEQYRGLFEESKDVVFISTPEGRFIDLNQAGVELFGYSSKEELFKAAIERDLYVHLGYRKELMKILDEQGYVKDYELLMKNKNGDVLIILETATAFRDGEGRVASYRGILRDITHQRKLEQHLMQSQKIEAIGQLAGGIAHDFNNMLTAIIGYGSLLNTRLGKDSELRPFVDQILSSAGKSANLTRQLLAFSRKQEIAPKETDLNELIKGMEKLSLRLIGEDIEFKIQLADKALTVMVDPGQIEQVLMNLSTNARDAMPDGGLLSVCTDTVELDAHYVKGHDMEKPGMYALISVADTGKGMDEKTQQKIFEPFFTTKEVGKGTGLGLSIVYGIIKQHGGNITVYSEPGKGTTFRIYLPLIESKVEETKVTEITTPKGGTETILIAEDNEEVRVLSKKVLEEFGYKVIDAMDGEDAINKFKENKDSVSLVMVDLIMPKKSGKEAIDEIRKIKPDVKVLLTSGYTFDIISRKGILEEGMDFISKPVTPRDLLAKIRGILDKEAHL